MKGATDGTYITRTLLILITATFLTAALIAPSAAAQVQDPGPGTPGVKNVELTSENVVKAIEDSKATYNENVDQIPGFVRSIIGNERINVQIDMDDGSTVEFGVVFQNARIVKVDEPRIDDPTMRASTTENAIQNIAESENPVDAAIDALRNGDIQYEGTDTTSNIKTQTTKILTKILGTLKDFLNL